MHARLLRGRPAGRDSRFLASLASPFLPVSLQSLVNLATSLFLLLQKGADEARTKRPNLDTSDWLTEGAALLLLSPHDRLLSPTTLADPSTTLHATPSRPSVRRPRLQSSEKSATDAAQLARLRVARASTSFATATSCEPPSSTSPPLQPPSMVSRC